MGLRTLKEMASYIAASEGREDDAEWIAQKLRGAADRDLLKHADFGGAKRAKRFPASEMFAGRVLLAALAAGIQSDGLAEIANDSRVETHDLLPDGRHVIYSRNAAFRSSLDPDDQTEWELVVFHAESAETRKRVYVSSWRRDRVCHRDPDFHFEAQTVIPVSRLLAPLVVSLDDEDRASFEALEA